MGNVALPDVPLVQQLPLLVAVVGPTGSGKTALAMELAARFSGEILSCDSVSVYRGMQLGTAKPSAEDRSRVPHHLLDMVDPDQGMTAGDWARAALQSARAITHRGNLPIVCGGTGLYLRALTEGLAPLPPRSPELRARLATTAVGRPAGYLHRMLLRLDAAAADKIHPNDTPKLMRAIEVKLLGGAPVSAAGRNPLQGFHLLRLGLDPPRDTLYKHLNVRAAAMFQAGLVEETRSLQERFGASASALGSLGYWEAAAVLAGTMTESDAIKAVQQGHRNYAKRQMTWFRREPDVLWLPGFGTDPEVIVRAIDCVEDVLQATLQRAEGGAKRRATPEA